ncbi:bifunctional [glutamine synthetase] adenylyltransferase/[glutamine synthetase]-adenylyl-L-tyrosine phosphorylase [Egicoccus halophilus]|uniref:Glutamate-ammonia-ligase adenylyltransferase n=1 Tax=Egicoccus halophilus TaxID=1670830 RepID=A0A8J3EV00_9ACTN|nr:bifunctional [glutamine synthetase] adenylyltransferase/[glutamine synthetase]-adenylyl-L-tyrosine phosphorylase [Egicoccus halophilus]GGI08200.1 glutamate-ammonia-ligase adenylyltransferase [Egicoccus halophilus]
MAASRSRSVRARLAAAGLDPDLACHRLAEADLLVDDEPDERLLAALSRAAEPSDALSCLTDLATEHPRLWQELCPDDDWLERLVAVAGVSRPLGDLLARHPDAARALQVLEPVEVATVADRVARALLAEDDSQRQAAAVARIRRGATADIAARDLTGLADVEEVAAELARLAEAVLEGTVRAVHRQIAGDTPCARLAVIGMGKLGGHELNYVSDVDVVFVHEPVDPDADDAAERASREARQVFTRCLEVLNASTTMGRAYEVDPTLRPEGRNGPLSRPVAAFVAYWERWAKTWEFQALLKARPVAGDRSLGEQLLAEAERFVWPDRLDHDVVAEIREMKSRIEAKPEVVRHGERQIKLGPGGIRDIEFAVQLLQLVHGRGDRSLRDPGTLPTLRALQTNGYVAEEDAEAFAAAYRMLRTVEHRLQLAHERRTHTIPDDPERQEWLARSLGYRAGVDEPARTAFVRELTQVQTRVKELHAKLFYRPLLETYATLPAAAAGVSVPVEARRMGDEAAQERLEVLGFRDGRAALRHVRAMTAGVSRRARTLRAVLPAMLSLLQETPDPDTGLQSFRELVDAQGDTAKLLEHLRDHPPASELLARVLGTSRVVGELLVSQPQGIDWLRDEHLRDRPRTRDDLVRMAMARLHWQDTTAALRRFKRLELLRIVLRDLAGASTVGGVGEELTALGEACLTGALRAELRRQARERGLDSPDELPVSVAIVGMGKLGGFELNYVSDLDVLFVHEVADGADREDANKLALTVAGNVMRSLSDITAEGTAFEVDADLRPEGRSGPLSRSHPSYLSYWNRWSEPWEAQALLKARVVAGDRALGQRLVDAGRQRAFPAEFGERDAQRIRRMKARIEKERIPRRVDPERHLKLGPGGISDVEWTVQLLQQRHGHQHTELRSPATMVVLDGAQDAGLLEHADAEQLREGYRFLSLLRNRLYLLRQRDVDVVPGNPQVLELLARSMGYARGGWQDLEEERRRHQRHVRQVFDRLFYGLDAGQHTNVW